MNINVCNINVCYYVNINVFAVAISPGHAPYYNLLYKRLINFSYSHKKSLKKNTKTPLNN